MIMFCLIVFVKEDLSFVAFNIELVQKHKPGIA